MIDTVNLQQGLTGTIEKQGTRSDVQKTSDQSFGSLLKNAISTINEMQHDADRSIAQVEVDDAVSIHDAMIALEKADLSFRTMMQVRNKLVDAYQEVMRMQV